MKIGTTYAVSLDIVYILYLYNNTRVAVPVEQSLCTLYGMFVFILLL